MARSVTTAVVALFLSGGLWAATTEGTAEFSLDNVLASKRVRSGETIQVVRDASWAEGGVTFSVTGQSDQRIEEGVETDFLVPDVSHYKVLTLSLTAGQESYSYRLLAIDGEPNVEAEATVQFALDSRTGKVRRAKDVEQIVYSSFWTPDATGPEVKVNGASVELAAPDGIFSWGVDRPYVESRLPAGLYVLTHDDGNEILTAEFKVLSRGLLILFR